MRERMQAEYLDLPKGYMSKKKIKHQKPMEIIKLPMMVEKLMHQKKIHITNIYL